MIYTFGNFIYPLLKKNNKQYLKLHRSIIMKYNNEIQIRIVDNLKFLACTVTQPRRNEKII